MNKLWLLFCALVPLVANAQLAPNYHRGSLSSDSSSSETARCIGSIRIS